MDTLKNRLDYAIKTAGKKQIDLTHDLGIPKSAISQYLSGATITMDSARLYAIAEYLGVNPVWLMGFDDTMNEKEKHLLEMLRSLNKEGSEKIMSYVADLVASGRYSL